MPKIRPSPVTTRRLVRILYGSQTGTAESFALELAHKLRHTGHLEVASCQSLKTFSPETEDKDCSGEIWLLLVATTGEGDVTDDARGFLKFLRDPKNADKLRNLQFSVFALGDMNYLNFCAAGKRVDEEIANCGGERIRKVVLADASHDMEDVFESWAEETTQWLLAKSQETPTLPRSEMMISSIAKIPSFISTFVAAKVVAVKELRQLLSHSETTAEIHIECVGTSDVDYAPGSIIDVLPENRPEDVARVLVALRLNGDEYFETPFGEPNIRNYVSRFVDLSGRVTNADIRRIATALNAPANHSIPNCCSVIDVIETLTKQVTVSAKVGQERLGFLPHLKPRSYSASGWPALRLCVSCKPFMESPGADHPMAPVQFGLCSEFLCRRVSEGTEIFISIRSGSEKLRALASGDFAEIFFICAGSGIAVFKAFLDFFTARFTPARRPEISLIFGCRHPEHDWLYAEHVVDALDDGSLKQAVFAFSRLSETKEYVQHKLAIAGVAGALLSRDARVVICGSSAMCRDVLAELRKTAALDVDSLCDRGVVVVEAFG